MNKLKNIAKSTFICWHHLPWFTIVLFLLLQVIAENVRAQNLDSIENVLLKQKLSPAIKIKLCDDLSWGYVASDFDKSKKFALQGISISEKENNALMTGTLYRNLGVAYYMMSIFDTAMLYFDKAIIKAKQAKSDLLEAKIIFAKANLHNVKAEYTQALALYLKARPVFEKEGLKERVRVVVGNIGSMYANMQNFEEAEKYFLQSKKISEEINDQAGLAQAYDGLNHVFINRKQYDKALDYALKAAEISRKIGNKREESIAIQGIAWVYYEHFKDFDKAEKYAKRGLQLARELDYPADIAAMLNTMSNIYFHQGRYRESEETALQAIETDTTDINIFSNLAANVVRSGIHTGNSEKSLYYFDKYRQIFNIQANKEYQQSLMDMQVKYETAKKEKEILKLESDKHKRNTLIYTLIGLFIALATLSYILIQNHRKNKIIAEQQLLVKEQQLQKLESERQLLATQSVLKGEESERSRLARDLHDGLGGLLSGVKINLSSMKGNSIITQESADAFDHAIRLLDSSISELRRVAHNMMPETLNNYGIKTALGDFIQQLNTGKGPKMQFLAFGDDTRYSSQLELTVFRIAQELVNNALKHAEAKIINLQLISEPNRICIQVIDDGKGFDIHLISGKGKGIENLRDRVISYNGRFEIDSNEGNGTEILVEFPV